LKTITKNDPPTTSPAAEVMQKQQSKTLDLQVFLPNNNSGPNKNEGIKEPLLDDKSKAKNKEDK
jgi:hypothetical protein